MEKPTYILSLKDLFSSYSKFSDKADVFYPIKCNDNVALLKALKEYGSGFEIETKGHLQIAMNIGVTPDKILFYSPFSNKEEIISAINYGVSFFVIDTLESLELLESNCKKYRFLIRAQVDEEIMDIKRLGASPSLSAEIINRANKGEFAGFSFYLNQEYNNQVNRKKTIDKLFSFCSSEIKVINVGGGIPVSEIEDTVKCVNNKCKIIFEPGRYLVDGSIILKCNIIGKKITNDASILFLNVGIYNGLLDVILKDKRFEIETKNTDEQCEEYVLSGPTGDSIDIIGRYTLPCSIDVGDEITFKNCGAYSEVLCTKFYNYNDIGFSISE